MNAQFYEDYEVPTFQAYSQVFSLFHNCKIEMNVKSLMQVGCFLIDKPSSWGFFYGAKQGLPKLCSVGVILFIYDSHFIKFKVGLHLVTNNWIELIDINRLLNIALDKGVLHIQVFGDSSLSINWNKGRPLDSGVLSRISVDRLKVVANIFEKI